MPATIKVRNFLWLLILIGVIEAVVVGTLHYLQQKSNYSSLLLAHIQIHANQMDAFEWRAIAEFDVNPERQAQIDSLQAEMVENMREFARDHNLDPLLHHIIRCYRNYIESVKCEFDLIRDGEFDHAVMYDEAVVDPSCAKLRLALERGEHFFSLRAERFNQWDKWGTWSALIATIGIIVFLSRHFLRVQEIALKAEANQLLLAESRRNETEVRKINEGLEFWVAARTEQLWDALNKANAEMAERQRLGNLLQQVSEQEKQRLGRDLHDGVGQLLAGAALRSRALEDILLANSRIETTDLAQVTQLIAEALQMTRNVASMLYPVELEKNDLASAIKALTSKLDSQYKIPCSFSSANGLQISDTSKSLHLYRIAQEAVTNALRHGNPSQVFIRLRQNDGCAVLEIENDGPVLAQPACLFDSMGCRNMKYRAAMIGGSLQFTALPGGGCRVACAFTP